MHRINFVNPIQALVYFLLCTATPLTVCGQVIQEQRYERKQKGADNYFTVISLHSEGLALLREKDKYNSGKKIWELIFLDTALQEKKALEFEIDNRNHLVGHEYAKGHLYFLYRTGETSKNTLQLVDFSTQGEENARYDIKPELEFKLTYFSMAGANVVLGGYVSKDPVVLIYESESNHIKVAPGFFQKDNELVDLRVNQNKTFNAVMVDRSTKTEKRIVFKTFDETGKLLMDDVVPIDDNKSLQTSITSTLEQEDLLLLGTWGDRQSKQSTGFFTLTIDPFNEQQIKYISLAELNHYLDYVKPARAKRIRHNSEKDLKAGRNPDFANYIMPFKIEEHKDGFLLLAEVYTPSGNSNPYANPYVNPVYGPNPYFYNPYMPGYFYPNRMYRPYPFNTNPRNPDEIRTTQAVLVAIDGKGKHLWDQSMKIEDMTRSTLEQVSDFYYANKNLVMMYKNQDNELKIKIIDIENGDEQNTKEKIKLSDPLDEFRDERDDTGLRYWYNNSFYVWGYQTIRNINNVDKVRDVFYVNKVVAK